MADRLILEAGKRVRKLRPSHRSWTKAKEKAFLEGIAASCNVKLAAKQAGVSASRAYVRRANDASFRRAWEKALSAGYAQLEMMLLERALHGVEKTVIARDGTKTVMREYSDRVALALLRMHRETVAIANEGVDDGEFQEARDRIVARLQRIRERDALRDEASTGSASPQDERGAIEIKGLMDRVSLIASALRLRASRSAQDERSCEH